LLRAHGFADSAHDDFDRSRAGSHAHPGNIGEELLVEHGALYSRVRGGRSAVDLGKMGSSANNSKARFYLLTAGRPQTLGQRKTNKVEAIDRPSRESWGGGRETLGHVSADNRKPTILYRNRSRGLRRALRNRDWAKRRREPRRALIRPSCKPKKRFYDSGRGFGGSLCQDALRLRMLAVSGN